jgi:hypothetical protein
MSKVQKVIEKKRGRPKKMGSTVHSTAPAATPHVATPHATPHEAPAAKHAVHEVANSFTRNAPEANYFILCNGKPIKNIKELADMIENMEDNVFNYHVKPDHNDFSAWIKDIFKDVELAEKLKAAKDKKHFQLVLYKHISHKLW